MIISLCLNPTLQKTLVFKSFLYGNVNRALSQRWDASGKGVNVSRVLTQLNKDVLHITQLGGRHYEWFCQMLNEDNIPFCSIPTDSQIRCCTTIIVPEPFCVSELVEEGETVEKATEQKIKSVFLEKIAKPNVKAVVISGSKAKGFSDSLYPDLIFAALQKNIMCIADFRGNDLTNTLEKCKKIAQGNLIIKPNFEEFAESFFSTDKTKINESEFIQKMRQIYVEFGAIGIITHGEKPLIAFDGNKTYKIDTCQLSATKKVQNTIGCGDSFTAGFVASFTSGKSFEESLLEANRCGALNAANIKPGSIL